MTAGSHLELCRLTSRFEMVFATFMLAACRKKAGKNKDGKLNWQEVLAWAENLEYAGQRVRRIQLLQNHPTDVNEVEVAAEAMFDGEKSEIVWDETVEDGSSRYFLLRVHHANDMTNGVFNEHGSTYSAPVWTGR